MPLQNRKEFETDKLHGVNLSADGIKLQMGWFASLANWIPAHRLKIKKKRGVDEVPTGAFFEPIPCNPCTDLTLRGQQVIAIEVAFDQATTFGGGNLRTSWMHIDNGELYSIIGNADCGGGNMPVNSTCTQINHYEDDNPILADGTPPPVISPSSGSFINTRMGASDVPAWGAVSNAYGGLRVFYGLGNSLVDYATPTANFGSIAVDAVAIRDGHVWTFTGCCLDSGPPYVQFRVFDMLTGTILNNFFSFGNDSVAISNMQLTDSYLYCFGTLAGVVRLYQINRADGVINNSMIVTGLGVQFVSVASDDLIYLVCSGTPVSVYYVVDFTDIILVGYDSGGATLTPFGLGTGIWNNGAIYYGSNGFGGFSTDVYKIAIACPEDGVALVASVSASSGVVPGGTSVSLSWADILAPHATDTIIMKPAPAAGTAGLVGTTIATFANSGALSDGSGSLAVPGGTTPGSYVLMYASRGSIWTATSGAFTVT